MDYSPVDTASSQDELEWQARRNLALALAILAVALATVAVSVAALLVSR